MGDFGPESTLTDVDTASSDYLKQVRANLERALRFLVNWYKATEDLDSREQWWAKIDQLRAIIEAAWHANDPADIFPGETAKRTYAQAQLAFPAMWRELTLSPDLIRHDLLDSFGSTVEAIARFPGMLLPHFAASVWGVATIAVALLVLYYLVTRRTAR